MLNFVQGLQYYMSYEVLEPNYCHLESKLSRVVTIDEVLALHTGQLNTLSLPFICTCSLFPSFLSSVYLNIIFSSFSPLLSDFLDRCLKDCLLTNREVVELNDRLLQCCLTFGNFMQVCTPSITFPSSLSPPPPPLGLVR